MSESTINVENTPESKIERTRQLVLQRLTKFSADLKWLIKNGIEAERPTGEDALCEWIGYGICPTLDGIRVEVNASDEYSFPVMLLLQRVGHEVIGPKLFPIKIGADAYACDQYLAFSGCITKGHYIRFNEREFKDYARARVELLDRVITAIKQVRIGYDDGSYIRL